MGDELPAVGSQALVHAVGAARVSSRRAQARDGVVRADEGGRLRAQRQRVETLFARLVMVLEPESRVKRRRSARGRVEGVFA